jgi:hypothetical protein
MPDPAVSVLQEHVQSGSLNPPELLKRLKLLKPLKPFRRIRFIAAE